MAAKTLLRGVTPGRLHIWLQTPEHEEEIIVHVRLALMPLVQRAELLELATQLIERRNEST